MASTIAVFSKHRNATHMPDKLWVLCDSKKAPVIGEPLPKSVSQLPRSVS